MSTSMIAVTKYSFLLGFVLSACHHAADGFSFPRTSVNNQHMSVLNLAWYDDDGYEEEESNNRRNSSRGRGGGRTASIERPKTRRPTGRNTSDWDRPKPVKQPKVQQQRTTLLSRTQNAPQFTAAIDCPHFGTCPGCVVNSTVADIDIIQSAKLYFSSLSVQKHIIPSKLKQQNLYDEEDFFKVRIPGSITQWRSQAKLATAPANTWSKAAGAAIGLYARHSHKVLSIPDCKVHHPSINKAINMIVQATKKVRTPVYQEDIDDGLLRYVQLQVEMSTGKVCLTLVMHAENLKECQPHLSFLVKELKKLDEKREVWHSIWCHCNDSSGNAIFNRDIKRWHPVEGPPFICEKIPGADPNLKEGLLYFSPMVFRQANLEGFAEIAKEVREAIPAGSKVCEMYAGVGLLGLSSLLHHGKMGESGKGRGLQWLKCSDENPENARCFERAVNSMPMHITGRTPRRFQKDEGDKRNKSRRDKKDDLISIQEMVNRLNDDKSDTNVRTSVTYTVASAASALYSGQALGADVLIVDPPRKGLDEPVLKQLCMPINKNQPYTETAAELSDLPNHLINWANDVRTLIYVSCGFDALARECDQLLKSNAGWELESATGYVLFPGSNHVETVVVLRR